MSVKVVDGERQGAMEGLEYWPNRHVADLCPRETHVAVASPCDASFLPAATTPLQSTVNILTGCRLPIFRSFGDSLASHNCSTPNVHLVLQVAVVYSTTLPFLQIYDTPPCTCLIQDYYGASVRAK